MSKTIIFGNSGSGKSTLAKTLQKSSNIAHLDLDMIAWSDSPQPTRKSIEASKAELDSFIANNEAWVIEGCYTDLIELVIDLADEIIYLNIPVDTCITNAKSRPWEKHKYSSKQAQDENLNMLIDWIKDYEHRTDTFSKTSHLALFEKFKGKKQMLTSNT